MKLVLLIVVGITYTSTIAYASEKSVYDFKWLDQDKEVYVLQNKKYKKEYSFYVGANFAINLNNAFVDSSGGQYRVGFFFAEDWGLELMHGSFSGSQSDTAKGVLEQGTVPFIREITSYTNAYIIWSPFYGKINTFNSIIYFDWIFGIGMTQVSTRDNRNRVALSSDTTQVEETNAGLSWTTGMRFYLTKSYSLRLDFTALHVKADRVRREGSNPTFTSEDYFHNYDISLGLNYTF